MQYSSCMIVFDTGILWRRHIIWTCVTRLFKKLSISWMHGSFALSTAKLYVYPAGYRSGNNMYLYWIGALFESRQGRPATLTEDSTSIRRVPPPPKSLLIHLLPSGGTDSALEWRTHDVLRSVHTALIRVLCESRLQLSWCNDGLRAGWPEFNSQ
jgi:hypothetical protein